MRPLLASLIALVSIPLRSVEVTTWTFLTRHRVFSTTLRCVLYFTKLRDVVR